MPIGKKPVSEHKKGTAIVKRLGGWCVADGFPPKPRGMHSHIYHCLANKYYAYMRQLSGQLTARMDWHRQGLGLEKER